jgi:exosortase
VKPATAWAAAALAALWLPPLRLWSQAWAAAPDQSYGWGVPALVLYLVWERSQDRPAPRPPGRNARILAWTLVGAGLLLFAAALPVLEANALWPTAQWSAALAAIAVTLGGLILAGGGGWAVHFWFPVAFILTALTWPTPLHVWIAQDLAGANAGLAAEVVSALGHPAVVTGNVIIVGTGSVGVAEACSGLRSLQAVWMAALFFGEFFRLNWPRRVGLVVVAVVAALAANLARTTFLTWQAAARGLAESERWHDPAGMTELVLTLLVVAGAALWIARRSLRSGSAAERPVAAWEPGRGLGAWAGVVLGGALLAAGGTQAWYRAHERHAGERVDWTMTATDPSWRPVPLPARVRDILQYSSASGLAQEDPRTGRPIVAFLISWLGDAANGENPEWHDPTVCLPGAGVKLAADLGEFTVDIGGVPVPFAAYRFTAGAQTLEVFFCHWDAEIGRARADAQNPSFSVRARRLERVREGRRHNDVAHITFALPMDDDAAALAWLREWAPRLLHPHLSQI